MKVVRESENLWRITQLGLVNCFLLREPDGFTLVDAGLPGRGQSILQAAETLGGKIRRIALTHAHFDHVGSLDEIVSAIPGVELLVGKRESRLLSGDRSLEPDETGKKLFGFADVKARPSGTLKDGDSVGSLQTIDCPGHTPGHIAFLDTRDHSLIAGDAFTNQIELAAAGVFFPYFPFRKWFSWNDVLSAKSAVRLRDANPSLLAMGHGKSVKSPGPALERAVALALRQYPAAARS